MKPLVAALTALVLGVALLAATAALVPTPTGSPAASLQLADIRPPFSNEG